MTEALLIFVGLLTGVLSATLGIGGGIVFVPALVTLLDFVQQEAQGTSLAAIVPTAMVGTYFHSRAGRVQWGLVLPIAVGGVIGGLVGAGVALDLSPTVLRRLFAAFLVLIALRMLRKTRARTTPEADPS